MVIWFLSLLCVRGLDVEGGEQASLIRSDADCGVQFTRQGGVVPWGGLREVGLRLGGLPGAPWRPADGGGVGVVAGPGA